MSQFPSLYQHVHIHVKPERDQNNRDTYRLNWWTFGEPRREFRPALAGLPRYIATVETSKHCFFTFLDKEILPDNMLIAIASDDSFHLGILSSSLHVTWALAAGGRMGMGNDPRYNKSRCFEPFPFPTLEEGTLKQRIRALGERLDSHRKRQQDQHPGLTLTGIYNVLEKLRSDEPLTAKEKQIHDQGLVTVLRQIHDELDEAVLEAYGWSDLAVERQDDKTQESRQEQRQEELLTRLVALNHERAAEEKRGLIRWLRPDYQNPVKASDGHRQPLQADLIGTDPDSSSSNPKSKINNPQSSISPSSSFEWPERLPEQVAIIRKLITSYDKSVVTPDAEALSGLFGRKNKKRTEQIEGILETLKGLGQL
jgi:hypothetical protein